MRKLLRAESAGLVARIALIAAVAFMAACQKAGIEPSAIAAEDMCSSCRMAISEKQYAAQAITADGDAIKFDDIGCMVAYLRGAENNKEVIARFVVDFNSRGWIRAEDAYYVKSPELKTPMRGGVVAFKDEPGARDSAETLHGFLLRFDEAMETINR
jgi:copper chaperone NosL